MHKREEKLQARPEDLARDLRSDNPVTRERACRALVAMGRTAVPVLMETLAGAVDHARREAARALSRLHDPGSAPAMVAALEDDLPGVRWLAGEGLIALGREGLIPLFRALIAQSDSVRLRQGAHHVVHALAAGEYGSQLAPVLEALEGPEPISAIPVAAFNALKSLEIGKK
ncbi:MAG TPA: HEAT repeat domain-containing protein [Bacteroidota bacterium]|nr:HEAT repeat domain-containing protein [Bacteroidota bacterium]